MIELNISGHNKIWGVGHRQKNWTAQRNSPRGYGSADKLTCMMTWLRTTYEN